MILRNDDGALKRYDEGGGSAKAVKASYDEDTALYAHAVGDFIYLNEHFYKVTVAIAVGDAIEDEVNVTDDTGLSVDTPIYVSNLPGGGATPEPVIPSWQLWIEAGGLSADNYSSLEDILEDEKAIRRLMTIHASVDYLAEENSDLNLIKTIINDDYCAKWINLRDYALDTLYANPIIKALMDEADKYFYGEWALIDGTWQPKGNVPVMTSDTAPYGEASASSVYSYNGTVLSAYKAFDGSMNDSIDKWAMQTTGGGNGQWLQYKFVNPICVKRATLSCASGLVKSFKIQGSNDGNTWTDVSSEFTFENKQYIAEIVSCNNNDDYFMNYRIYFTSNSYNTNRGDVAVTELQFYGRELKVSVPKMTSNTEPWGEVIYSSNFTPQNPKDAFQYDFSSTDYDGGFYSNQKVNYAGAYLGYEFQSPVKLKYVPLWANMADLAQVTHNIVIQGSNDSVNWTNLTTEFSVVHGGHYYKIVETSDPFKYFRVYCVSSSTTTYGYCFKLNFYGLDYSEYDWDEENPRHYLYDHGIELEEITLSGTASKENQTLKLIAANDQASKTLDTTNYTLLHSTVGQNASGTNALICGSSSATFTTENLPYNQSLDVSSVNGSNATGIKQTSTGTFEATEIWLE